MNDNFVHVDDEQEWLLAAYVCFMYARSWEHYNSEQELKCLREGVELLQKIQYLENPNYEKTLAGERFLEDYYKDWFNSSYYMKWCRDHMVAKWLWLTQKLEDM